MTATRALVLGLFVAACANAGGERGVTPAQATAIRAEIERTMRDAYDLSKAGVAERMMSLYPTTGRVISATGGRVLTNRDSIESGIRYFWNAIGVNMRDPKWVWESFYIDVLSPTSAVATATYRIPHRNPRNEPHTLGGAMTLVLEKRGGKWLVVQEHLSDTPMVQDTSQAIMPP